MNYKSEYEAYTHILIKRNQLTKQLGNMNMQMDFLLMNIEKGQFNDSETKTGALQELGYLITSSAKVSERATELSKMAENLLKDLESKPTNV